MNTTVRNPFSGDVSQMINPWQWWSNQYGNNSASLINITQVKSTAPEMEQKIVQEVAGYGMQLGKLMDAVSTLMTLVSANAKLTAEQKEALQAFTVMAEQIEAVKKAERLKEVGNIQQLIAGLHDLKTEDPALYDETVKALKAAI